MSSRWYREPMPVRTLADHFAAEIVAGLLAQIIERHCETCERLTGYQHEDTTYAVPGMSVCSYRCWRAREYVYNRTAALFPNWSASFPYVSPASTHTG